MGRKPLVAGFNMYPGICCSFLFKSLLHLCWQENSENLKLIFIVLIIFSDVGENIRIVCASPVLEKRTTSKFPRIWHFLLLF